LEHIGSIALDREVLTQRREFVHVAQCLMLANGNASEAAALAKSPRVARILAAAAASMAPPSLDEKRVTTARLKTAVAPGTTYTPGWAAEIAEFQTIAQSFIAGLKGYSAFDSMADSFVQLPPNTRTTYISLGGTGSAGSTPGEMQPVPVTRLELRGDQLAERVSYAQVVLSREVLDMGQGFDLLDAGLRRKLTRAIDDAVLTSIVESTGVISNAGTGDLAADLATAVTAMETGSDSKVFAIAPPAVVKAAAMERGSGGAPTFPNVKINGGDANGITILPSDSLVDTVVVVNARQCAAFTSGAVLLDRASQATLELSDDPTSGHASLISLFALNLRAIRVRRQWAFTLLDSSAAALITGTTA
jgi:hypothetical protein